MKKIPSLFKRDYEGNRQVYDETVAGTEWVVAGEGIATAKFDGSACMVRDGRLYKRYDRKRKKGKLKDAPLDWEPCEASPNEHTGHWPGWLPIGDGPEDKWHRDAWANCGEHMPDGTYELVGPKVQGNPSEYLLHALVPHGKEELSECPRDFIGIGKYLSDYPDIEGVVWHHPDGRMAKIKRRDFGLPWPDRRVEKE